MVSSWEVDTPKADKDNLFKDKHDEHMKANRNGERNLVVRILFKSKNSKNLLLRTLEPDSNWVSTTLGHWTRFRV